MDMDDDHAPFVCGICYRSEDDPGDEEAMKRYGIPTLGPPVQLLDLSPSNAPVGVNGNKNNNFLNWGTACKHGQHCK